MQSKKSERMIAFRSYPQVGKSCG